MSAVKLPGSLEANRRLSQWLRVHREGFVEVFTGKVEIGQGILTALAQIAADELDVPLDRVRVVAASTRGSPKEGVTSGSLSVQDSGTAVRHACSEARALYLEHAAKLMGADANALQVHDGQVTAPDGRRTSYWSLADEVSLDREATARHSPKNRQARRFIGQSVERIDLPDKVLGKPRFIHDVEVPGLVHGRVVRPAALDATLEALDEARVRAMPGVLAVVRDGSFLGVVSEREEVAIQAAARLRAEAKWTTSPGCPTKAA